jgi:hypothetical protein
MPAENRFLHQQYPTNPGSAPVLQTLNVNEAQQTDFSKLHTVLKIGRILLVHGTFMGDDPFGIADGLKAVAEAAPLLAGSIESAGRRAP